jgi:CRISPR-associated protein Cas2
MPRPGNMLHLVSYDLPSTPAGDRRRARLARYLEGLGLRVQMSVFELDIAPQKMPSICAGIEERIDTSEDSVRIYPLCGTCTAKVNRMGREAPLESAALMIW